MRGSALDPARLAVEAAFLLLVATGAGYAGLAAGWIVLSVAGAWALVALVEWQLYRDRLRASAARPPGRATPPRP